MLGSPQHPAVFRVVDRGEPGDLRNDAGAMEFFGAANVAMDPFEVVGPAVKEALKRLVKEKVIPVGLIDEEEGEW